MQHADDGLNQETVGLFPEAAFICDVQRIAGDAQGFIDPINWFGGTWH
jgi:hypothetical protein